MAKVLTRQFCRCWNPLEAEDWNMSMSSAKLSVLVGDRFACVKIAGRATFTTSIDFKTLLDELIAKGFNYFVLDLTECTLMDSTFLGVLAGLGLKLTTPGQEEAERRLVLFNSSPRILELLENLGVLHLFRTVQGSMEMPACSEVAAPDSRTHSRENITRACLEAHQILSQLNPANAARFKDVTQFLAEDLKRLKAGAAEGNG